MMAAENDHLDVLKWIFLKDHVINSYAYRAAFKKNHTQILDWMREFRLNQVIKRPERNAFVDTRKAAPDEILGRNYNVSEIDYSVAKQYFEEGLTLLDIHLIMVGSMQPDVAAWRPWIGHTSTTIQKCGRLTIMTWNGLVKYVQKQHNMGNFQLCWLIFDVPGTKLPQ